MRKINLIIWVLLISGCQQTETQKIVNLFEQISAVTSGVVFKNELPESATMNSFVYEYYYNGGGVATGDVNGDGLEDIFFSSNLNSNSLYLNTGDFQFIDVSKKTGISGKGGWTTGVSMVDINGDRKLDIYVCYSGPFEDKALLSNELYVNQGNDASGNPIFTEMAEPYGLASTAFSTQAAYLDYDLDGDLDVFLLNHNPSRITEDQLQQGRHQFDDIGDQFFENIDGTFIERTRESGIYSNAISYGLGVGIGDLNKDGWPDIYVSNDYEEMDYLYLNQKNKTFKEVVQSATRHISNFSMGNDIADYDNNGSLDILVLDMVSEDNYGIKTSMPSMNPELFDKRLSQGFHYQYMYNTLQRNTSFIDEGIPKFTDAGRMAGITNTGWSWAPLIADFDNDGWKDIFITNGIKRDFRNNDFNIYLNKILAQNPFYMDNPKNIEEVLNRIPSKPLRNYFYKNNGDLTYQKSTDDWLPSLSKSLSNGAAYADLDNDGDLDLIVNNIDEKASIYQNNSFNSYLKINLDGGQMNSEGLGAKVWVWSAGKSQYKENYRVRGFQSSISSALSFGLNQLGIVDSVKVIWPSGKSQVVTNVRANQMLRLKEEDSLPQMQINKRNKQLFQKETIASIDHIENDFDDYSKQVLLPHKLSQFGPAIAIGDVNNDGREDLFIGQASGAPSALYLQNELGELIFAQKFNDEKHEGTDALFFDFDQDGDLDLYVINGGNEYDAGSSLYNDKFYINEGSVLNDASELLPELNESGSVIKVHDFDQDGLIDLFIGTRHIPGDYPSPASSHLLKNMGSEFVDVTDSLASDLLNIGLVTDMDWSDIDQDGDKDMILVGEWMSPTVLLYEKRKFGVSTFGGLDSLTGWYNAVTSCDIDKDGDEDYLIGNLGNNYKYQASSSEPFEVYYADFDHSGSRDIVLGYYNFGELFPVRGRQCSSQQVPELKSQFKNYHSFGSSSLVEIYKADTISNTLEYKARNFSSGALINTDSGFEFHPFPNQAQLSSINDFLIDDFDKDGIVDLLVSGNLYQSEIETPRNDGGHGLLLMGDGLGNFSHLDAENSGFFTSGETRKLRKINVKGESYIISAINDQPLMFHHVLN